MYNDSYTLFSSGVWRELMIDVKQIEFCFSCACIDMCVIAYIHMIIKLRI